MKTIPPLLALLILMNACAPSFSNLDTLQFADLQYASPDGRPWQERSLSLPELNAAHNLPPDTRVHIVELGPPDGQPLIFIHGLGSYLKFWRFQLDTFAAQGYRVIALDLLGYGKSSKPATFPYTTEAMASLVRELASSLNAQKPILVGHSMGGQTALSFAIQFPDDLKALVLTAPAGFEHFSDRERAWFHDVFTTSLIKNTDEDGVRTAIARNNFARWRDDLEWLVEERVRLTRSADFDAYAYANVRSVHGLAHNDFVRDNLSRVRAPTLIIHGDWDRLIPNPFLHPGHTLDIMTFGRDNIPNARLVTLDRCGHALQLDCPDRYNQEVAAFLLSLDKPSTTGSPAGALP